MNTEIQSWMEAIKGHFSWYIGILKRVKKTRVLGHNIFLNDVPISIKAFQLRLGGLKNLNTPKEYRGIKKLLIKAMKKQIKPLNWKLNTFWLFRIKHRLVSLELRQ